MKEFRLGLITGAGGGLGQELCRLLEKQGLKLITTGKKTANLATEEGRKSVLTQIQQEVPDLVINNAGFGTYGDAVDVGFEEQREMLQVNAQAVMEISLMAAKSLMEKKQSGVVLNVSSVAGQFPTPGMAVYGATKAFVTSFSRALDFECAPAGVRILASLPGQIATPFAEKAAKKKVHGQKGAMTPQFAAREILWQIRKRKGVHAFDAKYRWLLFVMKHFSLENKAMKGVYHELRKRQ